MSEQPVDAHAAALDALRAAAEVAYTAIIDKAALSYAGRGDTARVLEMLDGGADIRAVDGDGSTLVCLAAEGGHTACVQALAARGADVNTADARGETPMFAAASGGHTACVRALAACGGDALATSNAGDTPLFMAVAGGHMETVRALVVEFGADANARNGDFVTPVFVAAFAGHTACVLALVQEFGADANTCNGEGVSPVVIASSRGHTETVRALVRGCGADLTLVNAAGMTPVYAAAIGGHLGTVQTLVREFGADVNTPSSRGFTPLSAAANRGDAAMAWTLVREGGAELDRAREQRRAFAMGLHPRLGRESRAYCLDENLLQMVLGPHVASGPRASEMAAERGHETAASVLGFLEAQEGAAPEHAEANAERLAGFICPVCLESPAESGGEALALVPCRHLVCRACWARIMRGDRRCPLCRKRDVIAVAPETFPASARLLQRFCVQL